MAGSRSVSGAPFSVSTRATTSTPGDLDEQREVGERRAERGGLGGDVGVGSSSEWRKVAS